MGETNKTENIVNIPEWMNNKFFSKIINESDSKYQNNNINVNKFELTIATNKGDNYASIMYRTIVYYELNGLQEKQSIILKIIPSGEIRTKVMEKNSIYPREIKVYNEVLKEIQKMLLSIQDTTKLSPKCLYTSCKPKMLLVFEDLKEQGYTMSNRQVGLELNESILILEKLAKLHACSARLHEKNPSIMDMYREGAISSNPNRQDFLIFFKFNARLLYLLVKQFDEYLAKKLENFDEKIIPNGIKLYERDDNSFNVFNHDDLWINNIMFKYADDGKLDDILMIDYQLSYWGSPGIDLNYFIYGSVNDEIRETKFKFLIKKYHETLVDVLKKVEFKGKIPTIQDIHIELIKTGFHAVNAAICLRPLMLLENIENADMDIFLQDTEEGITFRNHVFSNPKYVNYIKTVLNDFDLMGYFD